jgi:hypothetical protein
VEAIVKYYLPFQIVESPHFQNFAHKLNGAYKMPTRKSVSDVLPPQMYNVTKEKLKPSVDCADAVTVTTDGWTSIKNESYLSITAHNINSEMELKSSLFKCFKYDEKHTAVNLVQELKRVTREWGIENKVVAVVCDNAANIVAAVRLTEWKHIPCFAHTLNLIVQYGLQSINGLHT